MATQTKRSTQESSEDPAQAAAAGLATAVGTVSEFQRQQLAAGAEVLSHFFRAAEAVQQAQLQMGQRAALLHSQAADNLRKASSPLELASIQSTLVVYEFQEAMRYSQELMAAFAKSSGEMMRPPQVQDPSAAGASPAVTMMGAAMNAAAPMADAIQQMFTAPMKAAQASQATH
jgi:Phasin protein